MTTSSRTKVKAKCTCGQPRKAGYYVEVTYSTTMDTKSREYYVCTAHAPRDEAVAAWFPEFAGYSPGEVTGVHHAAVTPNRRFCALAKVR